MHKLSTPYKALCAEYYDLDKPQARQDEFAHYLKYAKNAKGPILAPMCGTGRYLIPLVKAGYNVTGFDTSPQMLGICHKKCAQENLNCNLVDASFESFSSKISNQLIFIPSSSFCLLTEPKQIANALHFIHKSLGEKGKFVFDIDTLNCKSEPQGQWKGRWVDRADGGKIVLSTLACFDSKSGIESILCRYELWENNLITKTEIEDFRVRLYEMSEIEEILRKHGFKITKKFAPSSLEAPDNASETVFYECMKV